MENNSKEFKLMLEKLELIFKHPQVCVEDVSAVLNSYQSNPLDWSIYANFDPQRYTRNLITSVSEKYNVMVLCWSEKQQSLVHSHSNSHCFVKVLQGRIWETIYDWPEDYENYDSSTSSRRLNIQNETEHPTNGVTYIHDKIGLHKMSNKSSEEKTVTLHVYSPPYKKCLVFDETGSSRQMCTANFYSKYGIISPKSKVNYIGEVAKVGDTASVDQKRF